MLNTIKRLVIEEQGQGMAEYALILVAIALACIGAYNLLGTGIEVKVDEATSKLELGGGGSQ